MSWVPIGRYTRKGFESSSIHVVKPRYMRYYRYEGARGETASGLHMTVHVKEYEESLEHQNRLADLIIKHRNTTANTVDPEILQEYQKKAG